MTVTKKIFCDRFYAAGQGSTFALAFGSAVVGADGAVTEPTQPEVMVIMPLDLAFELHATLEAMLSPIANMVQSD